MPPASPSFLNFSNCLNNFLAVAWSVFRRSSAPVLLVRRVDRVDIVRGIGYFPVESWKVSGSNACEAPNQIAEHECTGDRRQGSCTYRRACGIRDFSLALFRLAGKCG